MYYRTVILLVASTTICQGSTLILKTCLLSDQDGGARVSIGPPQGKSGRQG